MSVKRARLVELEAKSRVARVKDRVQAKLVEQEIASLRGEIERLQVKIDALVITSPAVGRFVLPAAADLPGHYVHQGKLLGYVVDDGPAVARVVVTQRDQDRITQRVDAVELRLVSAMQTVLQGRLIRVVPQASHQLPSKVLSVEGGGLFTPDPSGITELSTRERLFEYEVELPLPVTEAMIGSRVFVRFDHGRETLWTQLGRRIRQLFLRRLNVW
jgi:putative peptide zinc metalloprotease protein